MADDKVEGQEVDLLIRELSSSPRKRTTAENTESQSVTPAASTAPAPPAASQRSTTRAVAPPVGSRAFVSAISVQRPETQSWFDEHVREHLSRENWIPRHWIPRKLIPKPTGTTVVWMCVGLAVALALAMPFWPYPKACAWWLLLYLFAVAMVVVAGIWTARMTWMTRLGVAHMVAVGIVFWGITLAAEETLPRIGYAKTEAAWFCR